MMRLQHVADSKLPGTVVLVARKGKLIYADATGLRTRTKASRWRSIPCSEFIP